MLKHVSFVTAHPDAVRSFYTLLGAEVSKDLRTSEGFRRLVLSFEGGGKLQFFERPPAPGETSPSEPGSPHTEVQTNLQDWPDSPVSASQLLHPASPDPHAWMEHVALYLPDLEASIRALKARSVPFVRDLTLSPSGNPMAFVLDPDGRQVELLQGA